MLLILWGGVNTVTGNLVLSGTVEPDGGYDHDGMVGHAWLWDPLFFIWGVALVVGLCGSFLGLLSLLFPVGIQRCFPWGYYGLLLLVQMHWEEATRITTFSWRTPEPLDVLLLVAWWVAFGVIGYGLFARKEE